MARTTKVAGRARDAMDKAEGAVALVKRGAGKVGRAVGRATRKVKGSKKAQVAVAAGAVLAAATVAAIAVKAARRKRR